MPFCHRISRIYQYVAPWFNFSVYNEIFHCSLYPGPPPLISQGLVDEETQDFRFLRPSEWRLSRCDCFGDLFY
jgi:hypothetical protein